MPSSQGLQKRSYTLTHIPVNIELTKMFLFCVRHYFESQLVYKLDLHDPNSPATYVGNCSIHLTTPKVQRLQASEYENANILLPPRPLVYISWVLLIDSEG